uniref:Uncharacterized protein n=1 Tax=Arundo donax TaxID=35708 RepID=A0A0A9BLC1_ARUDO
MHGVAVYKITHKYTLTESL